MARDGHVTGTVLRRARPVEYPAIGEVTVAAYGPFLSGPTDGYADRLRDAATRDAEAEVWVAADEASGAVLGNVTVCPVGSPWRELAADDEGEFRMLAVHPDAHGRGVGSALAGLAVERFRTDRARAVVLSSLPQMAAAHRLYARMGFVREPARDWQPSPGVELLAFRLDL